MVETGAQYSDHRYEVELIKDNSAAMKGTLNIFVQVFMVVHSTAAWGDESDYSKSP